MRCARAFRRGRLHAIQLDHRALFHQRWRQLLLDRVLTPEFVAATAWPTTAPRSRRAPTRARLTRWAYLLLRSFRLQALKSLFAPLAGMLEAQGLAQRPEDGARDPGWALIQAARPDTLPAAFQTWPELLQRAVLDSRGLLGKYGSLAAATWGADNPTSMRHPLSLAVPALAGWLDQASQGMAGDSHMPRVHNHGHGQSERMVVSPGHEERGILVIPGGQSGHPMSPFYRAITPPGWPANATLPARRDGAQLAAPLIPATPDRWAVDAPRPMAWAQCRACCESAGGMQR
jgi:penicillin amidase